MVREWLTRHMDAKRAFSLVLGAVAQALLIVALAATPGFLASGGNDGSGLATYGIAFGGAFGFATQAFLVHRKSGIENGLLWALAQGGSMALLLVGTFAAATAISPIVSRNSTLGGDTWLGLMATAVGLGLTSNLMWQRNPRRRRTAAIFLLAAGFIIGGFIGLRSGGFWTLIGVLSLSVGIIAVVMAMAEGFSNLKQAMAETAA